MPVSMGKKSGKYGISHGGVNMNLTGKRDSFPFLDKGLELFKD